MNRFCSRRRRSLVLIGWLAAFTACSGTSIGEFPGGPFSVALVSDSGTPHPFVRVTGWSSAELQSLRRTPAATWETIVRISVAGAGDVPIAAAYRVTPEAVELQPTFPLDAGRAYVVRVDGTRLPVPRAGPIVEQPVQLASAGATPSTRVTAIYPTSSTWPENILRFYLHFSAPMSGTSAIGHVKLVDDSGAEVRDALLEVDVDLWNTDYTRRTVFFDPGRVKHGIRPNVELGRALVAGRKYAILVRTTWRDARGQALAKEFRHDFTAGPAVDAAVDPAAWSITPPPQGTRSPLLVTFPWALDEGLLQRAVGVTAENGQPLDGTVGVGTNQTSWTFTPASPWRAVPHSLVVLTLLEDPAGNKVGQPFEFEIFNAPKTTEAERVTLPFRPR